VIGILIAIASACFLALLSRSDAGAQFSAPSIASQSIWDEVSRGDPSGDMLALTFDAGGVAGPAGAILDTLRQYDLRLTFFLSGQWVENYPALAQQVAADGHELANHSYYHPDLTRLSNAQIIWELDYTDGVIQANLGRGTRPWFRPPFGARNQRVLDVARELGFRSVFWTIDSGDWRKEATAAGVLRRVLGNVGPGDIVVHHVAAPQTATALPAIIEGIQSRGMRIVTVSELLGLAPEQ
jgi:peptidoglycan/xylan/chitin deacetylase (PgdA/CDA1 family)